ncbi:MAG: HNH endonuclease [Candidatus Polarisedimenticolia bacterium]
MTRKSYPVCYICESAPGTTKDHIIPQNLFPKGLRNNLWTAPACRPCNDSLAPDEELFRIFITGQANRESVGLEVWRGGVRKTLAKQPKLKAMLAGQMRMVEVRTPAGIILGKRWAMFAKQDRIEPVIMKIVRGLYYREHGKLLGPTDSQVFLHPTEYLPAMLKRAKRGQLNPPVFEYAFVVAEDDPRATIWWLIFYQQTLFVVSCMPPGRQIAQAG